MTLRLVALMSVVLLVSLAAFALLGAHFQEQAMDELQQIVSTVGRETLRSLDRGFGLHAAAGGHRGDGAPPAGRGNVFFAEEGGRVIQAEGSVDVTVEARSFSVMADSMAEVAAGEAGTNGEVIVLRDLGAPCAAATGEAGATWVAQEHVIETKVMGNGEDGQQEAPSEGAAASTAAAAGIRRMVIRLSDVRAEEDPAEGLVMKIPTFTSEGADDETGESGFQYAWVSEGGDADGAVTGHGVNAGGPRGNAVVPVREMAFAVPTGKYQDLFRTIKGRSLALFFGVLLVGTALSAGLASRFTRPIRRLDAGIHRLSQGDLDVAVDVGGHDEIGRLGKAFNEMAGSLRVSRERERELTRREKLSALGRLAAGVAHDVRNPLHSIGLTLQNIQDGCRPEDQGRAAEFDRSVGVIREEIRRLDHLVSHFLLFARGGGKEPGPVDFPSLLRETVQLVEREAERRGVVVTVDVQGDVPAVRADADSVRSSVLNLVLNSFEAMPDGGRVSLLLRREGDEAIVEVADDGPGIPADDRERVFEFAYTTREGGHGLGLPMVHKVVVEDHGGRVVLGESQGGGTRLLLAFPLGGTEIGGGGGGAVS